jgi:Secretion system C-terminal sorting domain
MLKRLILVSMALLLFVGMGWASDIVYLEPNKVTKADLTSEIDELDEFFYLSRTSDYDAEYYLGSGALSDTMAVHFFPLAPCSVYFAEMQWFNAGPFQAFVWEYSEACEALYPDGRAPYRGQCEVSPFGESMFGPFNNSAEGSGDWEPMFTSEDLLGGGIWFDEPRPFIVGFVKTAGAEPNPLADDIEARGFSYTWFAGPWMAEYDNPWGGYGSTTHVTDLMMRVGVTYPLGAPPIMGSMNQLSNTPNGGKTCTVSCNIVDDVPWSDDHEAMLFVKVGDATPVEYEMLDPDLDENFEATFTIDAATGEQVNYWIVAEDDEGQVNSNIDSQLFFAVVDMTMSDAAILYIDHGSNNGSAMRRSLRTDLGWYFEYWDVTANKGIDEFVLAANSWDAVIVTGWGANSTPTREYDGNPYASYLMDGGNFFFADQDYFYSNGEDAEPTFSAGDFAYDVFGIQGGLNDPEPTDTTYFGESGDEITGDFEDPPFYVLFDTPGQSWADGVTGVATAIDIFYGEDLGNVNGIRYENGWGGKTVYLGIGLEYAVEVAAADDPVMSDQFETLMTNVITWFSANDVEETEAVQPTVFSLAQNYPNPFNPSTQISFTLPYSTDVTLTVFNVAGQQVATLVNGQMSAGHQDISFDASSLSSGVYFYTLQAGDFTATRKMMLMK